MATASKWLLNAPTGPTSQNLSSVLTAFVVDHVSLQDKLSSVPCLCVREWQGRQWVGEGIWGLSARRKIVLPQTGSSESPAS